MPAAAACVSESQGTASRKERAEFELPPHVPQDRSASASFLFIRIVEV